MQQESRRGGRGVDPVDGHAQGGDHVGVSGFVEPHVAIADLNEAQLAVSSASRKTGGIAEAVRSQNSSLDDAQGSRAGPGHTLQKPTAVNSVVVVIVNNQVFLLSWHRFLLQFSPPPARVWLNCLHPHRLRVRVKYSRATVYF